MNGRRCRRRYDRGSFRFATSGLTFRWVGHARLHELQRISRTRLCRWRFRSRLSSSGLGWGLQWWLDGLCWLLDIRLFFEFWVFGFESGLALHFRFPSSLSWRFGSLGRRQCDNLLFRLRLFWPGIDGIDLHRSLLLTSICGRFPGILSHWRGAGLYRRGLAFSGLHGCFRDFEFFRLRKRFLRFRYSYRLL